MKKLHALLLFGMMIFFVSIILWHLSKSRPTKAMTFDGAASNVLQIAFSPDSQLVLTVGDHGKIAVHQTSTGRELWHYDACEQEIQSIRFSDDGSKVAAVIETQTSPCSINVIRTWDTITGVDEKEDRALEPGEHFDTWNSKISHDGSKAIMIHDGNQIEVRKPSDHTLIRKFSFPSKISSHWAISQSCDQVALTQDEEIILCSTVRGTSEHITTPLQPIIDVAFSNDEEWLVATSDLNFACLNLKTLQWTAVTGLWEDTLTPQQYWDNRDWISHKSWLSKLQPTAASKLAGMLFPSSASGCYSPRITCVAIDPHGKTVALGRDGKPSVAIARIR